MSSTPELDISVWGPRTWGVAEQYAQMYPWIPSEADKADAINLFKENGAFSKLVLCPTCVRHYNTYARENPPAVDSREAMIRWILRAHNLVNQRNGKPLWTYEQVNRRFWGPTWRSAFRAQQSRVGFGPLQPLTGVEPDEPPNRYTNSPESLILWFLGIVVLLLVLGGVGWLIWCRCFKKKPALSITM